MGALRSVARPGQPLIEYVTNAEHRRIGKFVDGTLVQAFVYDKGTLLPIAELDGAGNVVAEFVYGEQSHSPSVVFWGGNVYRIVSDHLGSPRLVYNVASPYEIVLRRDYDEYGNVILDQLGGAWATAGYRLPFGFAGGLYDFETGLTRFGTRDYDPLVGRWTSKDPIRFEGGVNIYVYVGNDPVNGIDPWGLASAGEYAACYLCQASRIFITGACTVGAGPVAGGVAFIGTFALCAIVCKPVIDDFLPGRVPELTPDPMDDDSTNGGICEPPSDPEPNQCGG